MPKQAYVIIITGLFSIAFCSRAAGPGSSGPAATAPDAGLPGISSERLSELQEYAPAFDEWTALASGEPLSPVPPLPGDLTRDFRGPDGRAIRIVVAVPHPTRTAPVVTVGPVAEGDDARPAFDAALAKVRQTGAGRLIIPRGIYTFTSVGAVAQFSIVGVKDLEIVGNGSTLKFARSSLAVYITESQRVRLSNLVIQTTLHTRSLAKVADVNGTPTLIVDANYPVSSSDAIGSLFERDPATGARVNGGQRRYYPSNPPTFVGNNSYVSPSIGRNLIGKTFTAFHYFYGGPMIRVGDYFRHTQDVILDHVNIRSGPGMGIVGFGIKRGFAIMNCEIRPDEGALGSTLYDGIQVSGSGGDTLLDAVRSSGEGDDHGNLNSPVTTVRTTDATGTIFQMGIGSTLAAVGDKLAFFDLTDRFLGSATVTEFKNLGSNNSLIKVNHAITGVAVQTRVRNTSLSGQRWSIENGDFNNGGRIVAQVPNGRIFNNQVRNSGGIAVLTSIGSFNEGIGGINVAIDHNALADTYRMDPTSYTLNVFPWAAISVYALDSRNHADGPLPINRDVQITHNIIRNSGQACVSISSTQGVLLGDNDCSNPNLSGSRLESYNVLPNAYNVSNRQKPASHPG